MCIEITDIADAAYSFDALGRDAKLFSKVADMNVDASIEWRKFPVQYNPHQIFPGNNPPARFDQRDKQIKFRSSQFNCCSADAARARALVQVQIA